MESEAPASPGDDRGTGVVTQGGSDPVPDSLMRKLHEATVRFQKARSGLEETMKGFDYRHDERVAQNENEIREAEHELEEVDREIQGYLGLEQSS
jgi:hypothetical protein